MLTPVFSKTIIRESSVLLEKELNVSSVTGKKRFTTPLPMVLTDFLKFIQLLLIYHPISRAFIGNPLFPLSLEVSIHYFKDS